MKTCHCLPCFFFKILMKMKTDLTSVCVFNPFKPIGISHDYQLDRSISILRVVGWYFLFLFKFVRAFCKQSVETLIRRRILQPLIWVSAVFLRPTKRMLGLYGLKEAFMHL